MGHISARFIFSKRYYNPRFVLCSNSKLIQIHGFSDASETGYGACIYLRSKNSQGKISVNFIYVNYVQKAALLR